MLLSNEAFLISFMADTWCYRKQWETSVNIYMFIIGQLSIFV